MAILLSEDEEVKSSFGLIFLKEQIENKQTISWIPYKIQLTSANKELIYEKKSSDTVISFLVYYGSSHKHGFCGRRKSKDLSTF